MMKLQITIFKEPWKTLQLARQLVNVTLDLN